ncbi:unnamed protein product [Adineta ricciae]|uniref:PARP catalytic domain-containing protein n=1 Tax=Adineta ricciae TaxID=249248 RepID=A0A814JET4_ADIRI|nr:unnamed protein product [Adineta ricciae]CAF1037091.1 unnamed protein product [Adineta ricciae]
MWLRSTLSSVKFRDVSSYRRLHSYNIAVVVLDSIFAFIRIIIFYSGYLDDGKNKNVGDNNTALIGYIIDMIGSAIALVMLFFLSASCAYILCVTCCYDSEKEKKKRDEALECIGQMCHSPAVQRFVTLNCNCPCYITRPQHRFVIRMVLLFLCLVCRFTAFIIYLAAGIKSAGNSLAGLCGASWLFLLLAILLQVLHYRIWWHYLPSYELENKSTEPLSKKHKRYIPHHLLGNNRTMKLGDQPCDNGQQCTVRSMEHVLIFHRDVHTPQLRWSEVRKREIHTREHGRYIGFHQTSVQAAASIAHSDFLISNKPPQMLGFGIYFARSQASTLGKARHGGAIICAEIRMGKVLQVTKDELDKVRNTDSWWDEYDTVYYNHVDEIRDEFCIKSPEQILRWVIVVDGEHDTLVNEYKLPEEFNDVACGCV